MLPDFKLSVQNPLTQEAEVKNLVSLWTLKLNPELSILRVVRAWGHLTLSCHLL